MLQMEDLVTNSLDLQGLLDSALINLTDLVGNSLVGFTDLVLDQVDIAGLIDTALLDLGDLAREGLLLPAQMAIDELLASEISTKANSLFISISAGGLIGPGSIIDLDNLLAGSPIKLSHLIYFGIIDLNDIRPLGDIAKNDLLASHIIDRSMLERNGMPEIIQAGYLTMTGLFDLGQLSTGNLADLPVANLSLFGFSRETINAIDGLGLIAHGDGISLNLLLNHTNVTLSDLLQFGLISVEDLNSDLTTVLLDNVFVQGSVDRNNLLASDLIEMDALTGLISQDANGIDIVLIADLIDNSLATLADLVHAGLITQAHFNLGNVTVSENDLLASGLVPQNKLDDNYIVRNGDPDYVEISPLLALQFVSLYDLALNGFVSEANLNIVTLGLTAVLESDVIGENALLSVGLGGTDTVDLEELLASGLVTEEDLILNGLAFPRDFYDDSVVTLLALVDAGLVDETDLTANSRLPLDELLESDVVGRKYINDNSLADADGIILIEDLLSDSHLTFASLVNSAVLIREDFRNRIFEQSALEATLHSSVPVFDEGQFDGIVHLGTVGVDILLNSILFGVTLYDFVQHEFVDIFDFDNIVLTVADVGRPSTC